MSEDTGIKKEFLEKSLGWITDRFEVKPGSLLGDGYMCVLHSIAIWRKGETKPKNVVLKCFPNNPARQEFLQNMNIFKQELGVYQELIPELEKFQADLPKAFQVDHPFAKLLYGNAVDKQQQIKLNRPLEIMDNCIIMPDLRTAENGSFRLRDRFLGFDLNHYSLVVEAQARLHALSWAYKVTTDCKSLEERFPFLNMTQSKEGFKEMMTWAKGIFDSTRDLFPGRQDILQALDYLEPRHEATMGFYFTPTLQESDEGYTKDNLLKVPGAVNEKEEPWLVLLHGDAWSNNMMFRYDERTGNPVEVVFVDLQLTREGEPLCDLAYTLYCCTTGELRQKHLQSMLHIYYDTFVNVCKKLNVPPLPGFTWEEFNRRFHRAKIFGLAMATGGLRVILKNPEECKNLDAIETDVKEDGSSSMKQVFDAILQSDSSNPVLLSRLQAIFEEMIEEGVV